MRQWGDFRFGFDVEAKADSKPFVRQVHGKTVWEINPDSAPSLKIPEADAVLTFESNREIHIYTADCLPVLLFCEDKSIPFAAVHSGWRGAMQGIVREAALKLKSQGRPLQVVFGPCLKACCFEVKEDFIREFETARGSIAAFLESRSGKMFFDLPGFVKAVELESIPANFHLEDLKCTVCSTSRLPSYRRNKSRDPHLRAWIKREIS
jgi:polyphenol oxidase